MSALKRNVIYGHASEQKGPTINTLLIDDQRLASMGTSPSSMAPSCDREIIFWVRSPDERASTKSGAANHCGTTDP
jgi:hypothetical protein